jgi:hypothetical protein
MLKSKWLRFLLLNSTSLAKQNAKEQLFAESRNCQADVGLICESRFTDEQLNKDFSLDGYTLFHQDRIGRKGGGVCSYVRSSVSCCIYQPHNDPSCGDIEIMGLKVQCCQSDYFVGLCHYPPNHVYSVDVFIT